MCNVSTAGHPASDVGCLDPSFQEEVAYTWCVRATHECIGVQLDSCALVFGMASGLCTRVQFGFSALVQQCAVKSCNNLRYNRVAVGLAMCGTIGWLIVIPSDSNLLYIRTA